MRRDSTLALLSLAASAFAAFADQQTFSPSKDNTLYETPDGSLSNGRGAYLFSGEPFTGELKRALVAFELGSIPRDAVVTSATLTLHVSRSFAGAGPAYVHRVLADWGEGSSNAGSPGGQGADATVGDATWLHRFFPNELWTAPGGDFAAAPSATTIVGGPASYNWTSMPLAADVQAWVRDPSRNFGWIVLSTSEDARSARRFDSRESLMAPNRPVLRVEYVLPACVADVDDGFGTGTPDGGVTIDDLLYYLSIFEIGALSADVDDGSGSGMRDGGVTIDDLLYFFFRFESGC